MTIFVNRFFATAMSLHQTLVLALLPAILGADPIPQHTSIRTGAIFCEELLSTANEARFRNSCLMDQSTFTRLIVFLEQHSRFGDSVKVKKEEKLMIFFYVLKGHSNRDTAEVFQHSGSSIYRR